MISYPRLLIRIRAAMIDGILIPVIAVGSLVALSSLGVAEATPKIVVALGLVILMEPVAVTFTGGTVGHHLVGIRVCKSEGEHNLGFFAALVRFALKLLLGIASFLLLLITKRRQAIHDLAASSVVVFKDPESVPEYQKLKELSMADEGRAFSSVPRRLAVILLYWFLALVVLNIATSFVSPQCIDYYACTSIEAIALQASVVTLLGLWVLIAILGWLGHLPGARKSRGA